MAGLIPKQVLEDIRLRNDIVEVIGSHFPLQRSGSAFKALCPFHKEKSPSFHVNPQRQSFHCFGCGAGGDVFKFIMLRDNVDFGTAARMLAERAGVQITWEARPEHSGPDKDTLFRVLNDTATAYHEGLLRSPKAAEARAYLEQRKLDAGTITDFRIGYAPGDGTAITQWLRKKDWLEPGEVVGLVVRSDRPDSQGRPYDRFRNRVMFPIHDEQGRCIGFSGRTLEKDPKGAKYVNSPETPLFRKSHVLYALHRARSTIVESREAIICEGQIDVIRCHQAGFTSAVAAQGTAFTEEHARILRRYADGVTLVFDPDAAGQKATIRTAGVFLQAGLAVRAAILPAGEDPDVFLLKHGREAFARVLKAARSVIDFQVDVLAREFDLGSQAGVLRVTRAVLETVAMCPDPVQRSHLLQQAALRLNVPSDRLDAELRHQARRRYVPAGDTDQGAPQPANAPAIPADERHLLEHLLAEPELYDHYGPNLPLNLFGDTRCRQIMAAVQTSRQTGSDVMAAVGALDDERRTLTEFAAELAAAPSRTAGHEYSRADAVQGLILSIWRRELKRRQQALAEKIHAAPADARDALILERHQLTADLKRLHDWTTALDLLPLYR